MHTHLYFIQSGADGPVKIGKSSDPERRLSRLQTGSPVQLRIARVVEGAGRWERVVHAAMGAARINGEWFDRETTDLFCEYLGALPKSKGNAETCVAMMSIYGAAAAAYASAEKMECRDGGLVYRTGARLSDLGVEILNTGDVLKHLGLVLGADPSGFPLESHLPTSSDGVAVLYRRSTWPDHVTHRRIQLDARLDERAPDSFAIDERRRELLHSAGMATDWTMTVEQAVGVLRARGEAA